jgi:hypothetical protein
LGFPTGWSFTTHKETSGAITHALAVIYMPSSNFSSAVAGEKEDFYKGSLSLQIFYFVIVLLYFIFACIF